MSDRYFATGYIRLLYRMLRAEGLSAKAVFARTGYAEADLMRADFSMPFDAQMRLCRNALRLARPGLGLRTGAQLQIAAHGALGTALQSAPTLGVALETFAQLIDSRASFFNIELDATPKSASLRVTIDGLASELVPFFTESILHTVYHCIRFYSGSLTPVMNYQLDFHPPPYREAYREAFGALPTFEAPITQISFHADLLNLVSPEADAQVHEASVVRCKGLMSTGTTHTLANQIHDFLLENPGRLWSLAEIAPLFARSERTLIRQLKNLGTTYQELRDAFLQTQALTYLESMTVEAVALALGFSDTSSFRRSFRRWFNQPPSHYRPDRIQ